MSNDPKKGDSKKADEKKDLTGIMELSALTPPTEEQKNDPFSVLPPVEQIDDFQSIDQLGMMDHEPAPEAPAAPIEATPDAAVDQPVDFPVSESSTSDSDFPVSEPETAAPNDFQMMDAGTPNADTGPAQDFQPIDQSSQAGSPFNFSLDTPSTTVSDTPPSSSGGDSSTFSFENNSAQPFPDSNPFPEDSTDQHSSKTPASGMDGIKNYSERARETSFNANAKTPFHLWMHGTFDPYSRDKLLLFITENPMGLNSEDLDRQINAGKVLLPRISEFAGIKLIQDLRDSGLSFKLSPSSRDADEVLPEAQGLRLAYEANQNAAVDQAIPVVPGSVDPKLWQAFDQIQLVQFLKAEILEVERSDLFQELLERMIVSLKQKARLKGAVAIGNLQHELKSLRLPSQYQVELKATLLKKL